MIGVSSLLVALALAQGPNEGDAPKPLVTPTPPPAGAPVLAWEKPVGCAEIGGQKFRLQCDPKERTCLVAFDGEFKADGRPGPELERATFCSWGEWDERRLLREGYTLVPAVAEAPPGWKRDERQRIMQVNFDLNRRWYLEGGWAPLGTAPGSGQGRVGMGFRSDWTDIGQHEGRIFRLRLLEGEAYTDGSQMEGVLLAMDSTRVRDRPPVHITTFFGEPRRHDLNLQVGWWVEAARLEVLSAAQSPHSRLEFGAAAVTVDLWRSPDLASFVRLRGGLGVEEDFQTKVISITPAAAAESDLTLDADGFNHLFALAEYDRLLPTSRPPLAPTGGDRLRLRLGYERILIAINDQPLSAVLEGRGGYRTDFAGIPTGFEWQAIGALRFSLWAPARPNAALQKSL